MRIGNQLEETPHIHKNIGFYLLFNVVITDYRLYLKQDNHLL